MKRHMGATYQGSMDIRARPTSSRDINKTLVECLLRKLDVSAWPPVQVPAGRQLIRTGEDMTRVPLVISGSIDAVIQLSMDAGQVVVPVTWVAGELAMVSHLFAPKSAGADVIASQDTVLRWLPIAAVEHCLTQHQALLVMLVRFLSQRLREVQARERAWLERGVHERVCASIARIALSMPELEDGRVVISATHEALAARCGVSRPKLSRELKRLEDAGRLRLGRGTIEIVDREWFVQSGR